MAKKVRLVGGNLVTDADFRKKLAGRDAGVEVQMVLEDLLASWKIDANTNASEEREITVSKGEEETTYPDREQLKITAKIFLRDFSVESLRAAVDSIMQQLGTDRIDTLFIPVPVEAVPIIGIGSGAASAEQEAATASLLEVWREVETLVEKEQVGGAGLCDLHPPIFMALYEEARIKPTSVQVNLKSCCVVPEELSTFAKSHKVALLTHSDPQELISEEVLRKLLYPQLGREAGHYSPDWIARFLLQLRDRGVLLDKRYIIEINK